MRPLMSSELISWLEMDVVLKLTVQVQKCVQALVSHMCSQIWVFKLVSLKSNAISIVFCMMVIHCRSTLLSFCCFRKYIISRKQCEVPLSVPWNPRNQVSHLRCVCRWWLQAASEGWSWKIWWLRNPVIRMWSWTACWDWTVPIAINLLPSDKVTET